MRRKQPHSLTKSADCALYAKLATVSFLRTLGQVVDSTVGDVVQLVRTLPWCRALSRPDPPYFDNGNARIPLSARERSSTISFFAISDAVRLDNPQLMLWGEVQ